MNRITSIMGRTRELSEEFIMAVSGWNEGKKQELKDRKRYGVGV